MRTSRIQPTPFKLDHATQHHSLDLRKDSSRNATRLIDFSVMGTAHSHPSGMLRPSVEDLNNFYGRIMVVAVPPYETEQDIAAFDGKGDQIRFGIREDQ